MPRVSNRIAGMGSLFLMVLAMPSFAAPAVAIKAGLSIANVSGDFEFVEPESKLGFVGAVALDRPLTPRLTLAPEVGYAMRGFSLGESEATDDVGNPMGTFESFQTADYLTIGAPVTLALPTGRLGFSLSTGPQVGIELSERFVMRGAFERNASTDGLADTDFGWTFGAGADLPLGPGRWGVEARYFHGFTNLNDVGPEDFHNRAFEVLATWKFGPGR